jgi:hypothetical protein
MFSSITTTNLAEDTKDADVGTWKFTRQFFAKLFSV